MPRQGAQRARRTHARTPWMAAAQRRRASYCHRAGNQPAQKGTAERKHSSVLRAILVRLPFLQAHSLLLPRRFLLSPVRPPPLAVTDGPGPSLGAVRFN